jgi:hypothetical protein
MGDPAGGYCTTDIAPHNVNSITGFYAVLHVTPTFAHYRCASSAGVDDDV